jgi:hypothetical protein
MEFYSYSVHRESILKKFHLDDTLYSTLLFPVSRSTCFGRIPRPSSGAQFKLFTASGLTNGVSPAVVVDEYCTKCHLVGTFLKLNYGMFCTEAMKPLSYSIHFQSYGSASTLFTCEFY